MNYLERKRKAKRERLKRLAILLLLLGGCLILAKGLIYLLIFINV